MESSLINKLKFSLGPVLVLSIITIVVYGRMPGHEFLNWDDSYYVTENEAVFGFSWQHIKTAFSSYYAGNYAPVQILTYMLDYTFWGLQPKGFLFGNLIYHTCNGILIYRIFLRWHKSKSAALIGAALFLVHPVQVESVAWISQRKTLVAMCFFLLAWNWYCLYREKEPGKGRYLYAASVVAFVLALLSKSVAVVFPLVILLQDFCFPSGQQRIRIMDKIPYILAAAGCALLALHSQSTSFDGGRTPISYYGVGPLGLFLTMLPIFCRYVGMVFWPANLSVIYTPPFHSTIDSSVIAAFLFLAGVTYLGFKLYRYDRKLGFYLALFWVCLLPVSQIIPIITLINDRYLYFPLLGAAGIACSAAALVLDQPTPAKRTLYLSLFIIPLIVLSVLSYNRTAVWSSSLALWKDAVTKSPNSATVWGNLGNAYDNALQWDAAQKAYQRGLELNPSDDGILYDWGSLYKNQGDFDNAFVMLTRLTQLYPNHIRGLVALGDIYFTSQNFSEARQLYLRAYNYQPDAVIILKNLGNLALLENQPEQAKNYFLQIESQNGNDPEIAYQLLCVESIAGRPDKALFWLEKALQRGYKNTSTLFNNVELSILWEDPRFKQLVQRYSADHPGTRSNN